MPVVVFFPVHELTYAVLDSFRVEMFSCKLYKKTLSEMDTNREKGEKGEKGKTLSRLPWKEKGRRKGREAVCRVPPGGELRGGPKVGQ